MCWWPPVTGGVRHALVMKLSQALVAGAVNGQHGERHGNDENRDNGLHFAR